MSIDPGYFCCSGEADALLRTQLKPVIPKRPAGLLPPQKVGGAAVHAFSSPPSISSAERVQLRSHARTAQVIPPLLLLEKYALISQQYRCNLHLQNGHQESSAGVARAGSPGKERFPQAPLPRRSPCKPSRCEKSQSTGDGESSPASVSATNIHPVCLWVCEGLCPCVCVSRESS